jgi:hypothetical protein
MKDTNAILPARHLITITCFMILTCLQLFAETPAASQATTPPGLETITVFRTNWAARVITNTIEVRMPTNIFVNDYRTNWVEAWRTNIVNAYRTNWTIRTLTNTIVIEKTQTNLAELFQTNFTSLNVTNWETVLVIKTNWFTRPITNVAEMNIVSNPVAAANTTARDEPKAAETPAAPAVTEGFIIDAARTSKPPGNTQVEVQIKLKSVAGAMPDFLSLEWRVERIDGSMLLFGQGPEFRQDLPPGKYKVELTARSADRKEPLQLRRILEVTREKVTQQKLP